MEVAAFEERHEDRQLVGGVVTVDVVRRIRLGVPGRDRLRERLVEAPAGLHTRADVRGRSVEEAAQDARADRAQAAEPRDDGHRGGDRSLEPQLPLGAAGRFVQCVPLLRHELLIRRHDVLAAVQSREDQIARRIRPADDLDDDGDIGIVEDGEWIGRDRDVAGLARLFRVADGRRHELHGAARRGVDAPRAVGERAPDRGPDRAEAKEPDAERFRAHGRGRPQVMKPTTSRSMAVMLRRRKTSVSSASNAAVCSPSRIRESVALLCCHSMHSASVLVTRTGLVRVSPPWRTSRRPASSSARRRSRGSP